MNVGDVAFVVDEVTANVHRRRFCLRFVAGARFGALIWDAGRCRRHGEQLDETCNQTHATPPVIWKPPQGTLGSRPSLT